MGKWTDNKKNIGKLLLFTFTFIQTQSIPNSICIEMDSALYNHLLDFIFDPSPFNQ